MRVVVVCATAAYRVGSSICACMCACACERARVRYRDKHLLLRMTCRWKNWIRKSAEGKHRRAPSCALARSLAHSHARLHACAHTHMQPMYESHPPPMLIPCIGCSFAADSAIGCFSVAELRLQALHDTFLPASPGQDAPPAGHRGLSTTRAFSVELVEVVCVSSGWG